MWSKNFSRPGSKIIPINDGVIHYTELREDTAFVAKANEKIAPLWWRCPVCGSYNLCPECKKCRDCWAGGDVNCLLCKQDDSWEMERENDLIKKELLHLLQKDEYDINAVLTKDGQLERNISIVKLLRLSWMYANDIAVFLSAQWVDDEGIAKALDGANYPYVATESALRTLWISEERIDQIIKKLQESS